MKTTGIFSYFGRCHRARVFALAAAAALAAAGQLLADDQAVSVRVGSTNSEIESALKLCEQYERGCERVWYEDEAIRQIELLPYQLDKVEVSVAEFADYVQRFGIKTEAEVRLQSVVTDPDDPLSGYYSDSTFWYNAYSSDNGSFPVVHVTLRDAANYCAAVGKRLPTEAEWEYAARGPDRDLYPWGDQWNDFARYRGSEFPHKSPMPVGSYQATERGYHDLTGSVSEWTTTEDGDAVIVKGGFRYSRNVANLRSAVRRLEDPAYSGDDVGFRCAKSLDRWPSDDTVPAIADQRRDERLRIESLLASARKLLELQKYDLALAELDSADAIDAEQANTRELRVEIQANRDAAQSVVEADQSNTAAVDGRLAVAEELLNRVKVKRKVRERNQALFNDYLNHDVADALVQLFESPR